MAGCFAFARKLSVCPAATCRWPLDVPLSPSQPPFLVPVHLSKPEVEPWEHKRKRRRQMGIVSSTALDVTQLTQLRDPVDTTTHFTLVTTMRCPPSPGQATPKRMRPRGALAGDRYQSMACDDRTASIGPCRLLRSSSSPPLSLQSWQGGRKTLQAYAALSSFDFDFFPTFCLQPSPGASGSSRLLGRP